MWERADPTRETRGRAIATGRRHLPRNAFLCNRSDAGLSLRCTEGTEKEGALAKDASRDPSRRPRRRVDALGTRNIGYAGAQTTRRVNRHVNQCKDASSATTKCRSASVRGLARRQFSASEPSARTTASSSVVTMPELR